jgi:P2-related tail formation protein
LRRVVEPLGYLIEVREWWQSVPEGVPGSFELQVGVLETGITEEMYQELTRLIDDAKPVSRHLTGLVISLETAGRFFAGVSISDGDEIDVYPPQPRDIEVSGVIGRGGREHTIDTLDIYS